MVSMDFKYSSGISMINTPLDSCFISNGILSAVNTDFTSAFGSVGCSLDRVKIISIDLISSSSVFQVKLRKEGHF